MNKQLFTYLSICCRSDLKAKLFGRSFYILDIDSNMVLLESIKSKTLITINHEVNL